MINYASGSDPFSVFSSIIRSISHRCVTNILPGNYVAGENPTAPINVMLACLKIVFRQPKDEERLRG